MAFWNPVWLLEKGRERREQGKTSETLKISLDAFLSHPPLSFFSSAARKRIANAEI